jgi:thiol-disulfide isomerase/thioredoxin
MLAVRWVMVVGLVVAAAPAWAASKAPTVEQALTLIPIQKGIDFSTPASDELASCTITPEKFGNATAWVVANGAGQLLRRFADNNADNVVDRWSYFKDGLEVYRDIDSNYDNKADQYRWFHTGGSRWAIDKNQDGKIDVWKSISPTETAEEVVLAVQNADEARFVALLLSRDELKALGAGTEVTKVLDESISGALANFRTFVKEQKLITPSSKFADFGASRPGAVPVGTNGSTKDVIAYENAAALVDNDGAPAQLLLGSLVQVDETWKVTGAPTGEDQSDKLAIIWNVPTASASPSAADAPNDEMQKLMSQLEELDKQAQTATEAEQPKLMAARSQMLRKLAAVSPAGEVRDQWLRQLIDMLGNASQAGADQLALAELAKLEQELAADKESQNLVAHARFRRISTENLSGFRNPKADAAKLQQAWLSALEKFVGDFPQADDAAEAMLQLGTNNEWIGEDKAAEQWYARLANEFKTSPAGLKAAGALRRLNSAGKPMVLSGPTIDGGKLDIADYRGKFVLVQYWATWCGPCKADLPQIRELFQSYGGKLAVVGVNLDNRLADAEQFHAEKKLPWKQLHDAGGLEGPLAAQMGVMNLPLMILVDDKGNVVNRNIHSAELEGELERLIK